MSKADSPEYDPNYYGGKPYERTIVPRKSRLAELVAAGVPAVREGSACVFPMVGGTHFAREAESDKSSPVDDILKATERIRGASSTRVWQGAHPPPAGIVEDCGCEQSVSLAERVELLETLLMDVAVESGMTPGSDIYNGLLEHVRQLAENCAVADRSDEIASLTRALEAERRANSEAVPRIAALALHNRMLLGLIEGMVEEAPRAPASPPSALARARSLCAEGLEFAWVVGGIGTLVAFHSAEALGAAALRKVGDALGWAAVGLY